MMTTRTRTALMAGVATLSLTVATFANDFSGALVFGDRQVDAGQFADQFFFFVNGERVSDGRRRWTNRDDAGTNSAGFGNYGHTWAMRATEQLGYGIGGPSQPSNVHEADFLYGENNYASTGYGSAEVLASINGTVRTPNTSYLDDATGTIQTDTGRTHAGLLSDPATRGWAANSVVIMNGGSQDVRYLANVERNVAGGIITERSFFVDNAAERNARTELAAEQIASGAVQLRDAGAGLVTVANLYDVGATPGNRDETQAARQGLAGLNIARATALAADPLAVESAEDMRARAAFEGIIANPNAVAQYRSEGTTTFNEELAQRLDGESGIVILDQNALVTAVLDDPLRFGLSDDVNHRTECATSSLDHPCTTNQAVSEIEDYFFLNGQDLTIAGHTILADHAVAVISAPVQVSGTPFVAVASGRAVADAGTAQIVPERIGSRGWAPFVSAGIGQSNWNPVSGEGQQGALPITGVAGVTYSFGNGLAVGVGGSYQSISNAKSEHATGYEGDAIHGTVFAGADFGRVFGSASATVGTVDFDSIERRSNIGGATIVNSGSSDADVFGASIEVGVRALTTGTVAAGPIVSLDHWSADVAGYSETGEAFTAASYDGFDGSSTRGSLGMFLEAGDINDVDMPVAFRMSASYTREFETDGVEVTARTATSPNNAFSREGRSDVEDSITVGAQLTYDFGPMIGSLGYDARIGESDDHYGRIDISVPINGGIR